MSCTCNSHVVRKKSENSLKMLLNQLSHVFTWITVIVITYAWLRHSPFVSLWSLWLYIFDPRCMTAGQTAGCHWWWPSHCHGCSTTFYLQIRIIIHHVHVCGMQSIDFCITKACFINKGYPSWGLIMNIDIIIYCLHFAARCLFPYVLAFREFPSPVYICGLFRRCIVSIVGCNIEYRMAFPWWGSGRGSQNEAV